MKSSLLYSTVIMNRALWRRPRPLFPPQRARGKALRLTSSQHHHPAWSSPAAEEKSVSGQQQQHQSNQRSAHHDATPSQQHPQQMTSSADGSPPPLLMLPYEEFYVSKDGVSRTFYEMQQQQHHFSSSCWTVEEIHDMKQHEKTYVVRNAAGRRLLEPCIREVDEGRVESVGTGATAWEASIVAALYLQSDPHLLRGDVLELGSGTGVGGILNLLLMEPLVVVERAAEEQHFGLRSFTFSDYEHHVLDQCRRNIREVVFGHAHNNQHQQRLPLIFVTHLDWYGYDPSHRGRYHTVVACDCAYRHCDVEVLGKTLQNLLSRNDDHARIHLFGPENRAVLHEVIGYLREDLGMNVTTELVHVNRFRLRPASSHNGRHVDHWNEADLTECIFSNKSNAAYLHVTASHARRKDQPDRPLADID